MGLSPAHVFPCGAGSFLSLPNLALCETAQMREDLAPKSMVFVTLISVQPFCSDLASSANLLYNRSWEVDKISVCDYFHGVISISSESRVLQLTIFPAISNLQILLASEPESRALSTSNSTYNRRMP